MNNEKNLQSESSQASIKTTLKAKTVQTISNFDRTNLNALKEFWMENKRINQNIKILQIQSQHEIDMYSKKINLLRDTMEKAFGEREPALAVLYRNLEKAEKENDRELIIDSLRAISGIIVKNPLEELARISQSLEFGNQDTLELDF